MKKTLKQRWLKIYDEIFVLENNYDKPYAFGYFRDPWGHQGLHFKMAEVT